jgi:cyclohexanone monooxygenase
MPTNSSTRASGIDAVVVGAGASGLYALFRLRSLGLSVQGIEAADDVGGTWWWNRYPGARCDIESMTYSYSFSHELEQEWSWSERYAAQPEILEYLSHVADRFDLRRHVEFGTRVTSAVFDETESRWNVSTDRGEDLSALYLIMATGCLSVPRMPDIPGVGTFAGEAYHTGLWPHQPVDFTGKRVAVIGTGSSAVQALPIIAETAAEVTIFQRTPAYSVPAWNRPLEPEEVRERKSRYSEYRRIERASGGGNPWFAREVSIWEETPEQRRQELEARYRVGGFYLHSAYSDFFTDAGANGIAAEFVRDRIRERVHDQEVAELLCPYDYPFATKRMCIDTDYYEAYNRENVRLVDVRDTPIEEICPSGLRVGGETLGFDMLVYATGFDAMTGALNAIDIRGRSGLSLREKWTDGPRSYLGLMVAGFPNLFTVTGPGSPSVLSNMITSIEQHVDLIADCVLHVRDRAAGTIEPTPDAEERWVEHVREVGEATLYPKAKSWYMGANVPGKPRVLLPYVAGVGAYRQECERIVGNGFEGFTLGAHEQRAAAVSTG